MCRRLVGIASISIAVSAALGCAGSARPGKLAPESARAEPKASSLEHWTEERSAAISPAAPPETDGAQAKIATEAPAPALPPEPERSPTAVIEALTAPGVAFVIDYTLTDAYRKASERCESEAGEDEAKRNACQHAARRSFAADAIRFHEDDDGQLWWVIYRRQGDELVETYSAKVEFADVGTSSVTVVVTSAGKGKRPILRDVRRVAIGVPNEYSIELEDFELGHLVYDAKVGLVGR